VCGKVKARVSFLLVVLKLVSGYKVELKIERGR
jgi:hypothetical protein